MTLKRFGGVKNDARKAEYEQSIVKLGLKKAGLVSEIDQKRRELKALGDSHDLMIKSVEEKKEKLTSEKKAELEEMSGTLLDFDEKVAKARKEVSELSEKKSSLTNDINSCEARLSDIEDEIKRAEEKKSQAEQGLEGALSEKGDAGKVAHNAKENAKAAKKELENLQASIREVGEEKVRLESCSAKLRLEIEELNSIISVLRSSNKDGLEAVASLEGERVRLAEKDALLDTVARDIRVYVKRLQKAREQAGIKTPLVLPPAFKQ